VTSVPQARSSDAPDGEETGPTPPVRAGVSTGAPARSGARAARRALALTLLCGAAGAALALLASGQVWSHATASFAQGELPVKAKGGDVTGLPSALALVGLAALVAVFAVKRAGRVLVAALLALCGTGTAAAALLNADDSAALEEKAAKASGLARTGVDAVHVSAWPYLSAAGGALLLIAGVLALRYGTVWPSMSGSARYERSERTPRRRRPEPRGAASTAESGRPEDMWKALDRGEDPTGDTA
jgi:uncharacterized membrane protein (TIGR02234 family)